jgi:hypothetical protein
MESSHMSILSPVPTAWQWPGDVLAFAGRNQVSAYLDPLLEATRRLFPGARSLKVFLEDDPEIRDDWHIVFEVEVPRAQVTHFVEAKHFWTDELYRVCPAPLVCTFRLSLLRVG